MPQKAPALFIGHGSPMNAIEDNDITRGWRAMAARFAKPRAIVCVSAHWVTPGVRLTTNAQPRTIHDFGGFPRPLFEVRYPAPGAPDIAAEAAERLKAFGAQGDASWGLDHGAWSVLVHLFPDADVPVVQLSLDPARTLDELYAIGQAIAALRATGVLILGSGNVVHNLAAWRAGAVQDWVTAFDAHIAERVAARDDAAILRYGDHPLAAAAAPDWDHFTPLIVTLGAAEPHEAPQLFNQVYIPGISMTSFAFGLPS